MGGCRGAGPCFGEDMRLLGDRRHQLSQQADKPQGALCSVLNVIPGGPGMFCKSTVTTQIENTE